ncbi:MAG: hypothetical protein EA360_02735 [Balneolaceae bacterium]|nr:MAG: hypothetical protein EA360_02735 [Balneolaceae bacterium]
MTRTFTILPLLIFLLSCGSDDHESSFENITLNGSDSLHIVFVTGDEEYRSEESMPMIASILSERYGFQTSVVYAITDGFIDPNRQDNIPGLEILREADLMVLYLRFRNIPDEQLFYLMEYVESGRPVAGFRTSTHAFQYGDGHPNQHLDYDWPQEVLGLPWISHHGSRNSTRVTLSDESSGHPILRGIAPFHARSWLYHATSLHPNATPLLTGLSVEGTEPDGEIFGEPHTVAWTHTYDAGNEEGNRVFFTTLGHPEDFFAEEMRRLAIQGFFWALNLEERIPAEGLNADFASEYDPNPAGFGMQFKQGVRVE